MLKVLLQYRKRHIRTSGTKLRICFFPIDLSLSARCRPFSRNFVEISCRGVGFSWSEVDARRRRRRRRRHPTVCRSKTFRRRWPSRCRTTRRRPWRGRESGPSGKFPLPGSGSGPSRTKRWLPRAATRAGILLRSGSPAPEIRWWLF